MIKTKRELVKQEIGLWAVPKNPDGLTSGEFPFRYELYGTTTHWNNSAIFLTKVEVATSVPEGLDLLSMAHKTLDQRAVQAQLDYSNAIEAIEKERQKLFLLAAPPAPEEGIDLGDGQELLPPDDNLGTVRSYNEPENYNDDI